MGNSGWQVSRLGRRGSIIVQGMGVFNPEFYGRYRPFYPAGIFIDFKENLKRAGFREPFQVADIGCGTGHSVVSLLKTGIRINALAIDPDPEMLRQAQALFGREEFPDSSVRFQLGTGENTGLPAQSLDAILVGSAFHWMNPSQAAGEFRRILKPKGLIRLFEYQFPKAESNLPLNEWIRRQFNLNWKAPAQTPRGNFEQITHIFRAGREFRLLGEGSPPLRLEVSATEVFGLILSQSRVRHYESSLSAPEILRFRENLKLDLERFMPMARESFRFKLNWAEFELA